LRDQHRHDADALLARAGAGAVADRACASLSYADVKRVELAVALSRSPRLLLMDEPAAGTSPRDRAPMMELVAAMAAERGTATLFTEHDVGLVFRFAARVIVLDRGRVIADGPPAAVRADARVRAVYLGTED
jgi:branched-chain amino acid transport system ATP-binding protein